LWRAFEAHCIEQATLARAAWVQRKRNERARLDAVQAVYKDELRAAFERGLTAAQRKTALSIARRAQREKETALRKQIEQEHQTVEEPARVPLAERYRQFLLERAQAGDEPARHELLRAEGAGWQE
jgi:hypothetical protein